eukprot:2701141-Pleurochrysis_carterae.AAC.4
MAPSRNPRAVRARFSAACCSGVVRSRSTTTTDVSSWWPAGTISADRSQAGMRSKRGRIQSLKRQERYEYTGVESEDCVCKGDYLEPAEALHAQRLDAVDDLARNRLRRRPRARHGGGRVGADQIPHAIAAEQHARLAASIDGEAVNVRLRDDRTRRIPVSN